MAAAPSADHKKKSWQHGNHHSRDASTGMSAPTKRHFDRVKQKLFAFVNHQQRMEFDNMHFAPPPPPPFYHHPPPPPPPMFFDQKKMPKQPSHHRTPVPSRKHLLAPVPPHRQLPHLALATPQVARRGGKP